MRAIRGSDKSPQYFYRTAAPPSIEVELTDFGVRIYSVRAAAQDNRYLRVSYFVMPSLSAIPGPMQGEGYNMNWHVPVDDTRNWKYTLTFNRNRPIARPEEDLKEVDAEYMPARNRANRYLQDREMMRTANYSGIVGFRSQDACTTEGAGPIQDRSREHLGTTDKAIVAARKLILQAIRDVQEGKAPAHVITNAQANRFPDMQVISQVISGSVDVKEYVRAILRGPARESETTGKDLSELHDREG
jgi:hypothetical protein